MKVKTSKGFTLAELLIVMAIIVVLAAVAIPTFGRQLETARETGDMELIRNAYADALSLAVLDGADGKLDNKAGGSHDLIPAYAAATSVNEFTAGASTAVDKEGTYTMKLAGTIQQKSTSGEFAYVNATVGGQAVTATLGHEYVTFVFQYNDEDAVVLKSAIVTAAKLPSAT